MKNRMRKSAGKIDSNVSASKTAPDTELARKLGKLWPHREHESSAVTGLLCRLGIHFWRQLNVEDMAPGREIRFCFWCAKVSIDGVRYDP